MITAITFQFKHNKQYLNPCTNRLHAYGDKYTEDLEKFLTEDMMQLQKVRAIVMALNKDLSATNIMHIINFHVGSVTGCLSPITKTKRTYSVMGLTIHEDDLAIAGESIIQVWNANTIKS